MNIDVIGPQGITELGQSIHMLLGIIGVIASLLGVLSGIAPAMMASKLTITEALRKHA